jgi:cyanophycin synthetase
MDPMNTVVHEHVANGGTAYVQHGAWIEEHMGTSQRRLIRAADIPVTLGGMASFQVANAMAALAAAIAVGVDRNIAAAGLREFRSDRDNAGRMNLYCVDERYVLLDYAHNPAALQAICNFISRWPSGRAVGVLGLPGDRSDSLLEQSARVAGCGLGTVILREDKDLRGRKPGEVPEMMRRTIASSYPDLPVEVVPDELEAIRRAVERAKRGDVIVVFVEKVAAAVEMLTSLGATAVTDAHLASRLSDEPISTMR